MGEQAEGEGAVWTLRSLTAAAPGTFLSLGEAGTDEACSEGFLRREKR